jgi:orotidine-5'-phosphate decarboxylase
VGKQGGDIKKTVKYGTNKKGEMAIINSSRGIIYKSNDHDFAEKARNAALSLRNEINKYR